MKCRVGGLRKLKSAWFVAAHRLSRPERQTATDRGPRTRNHSFIVEPREMVRSHFPGTSRNERPAAASRIEMPCRAWLWACAAALILAAPALAKEPAGKSKTRNKKSAPAKKVEPAKKPAPPAKPAEEEEEVKLDAP